MLDSKLPSTQYLIGQISSNQLDALEIKRGDGSDMFTEKDFITADAKLNSAAFNNIKSKTQYFDMYLYPQIPTVQNSSHVTARLYQNLPIRREILTKGFPLLNGTNFLKVTLLPSEDYVVMGGAGGYVYMINIKTCSIDATQQFCKADITHIKYDPTLNLFVTRSVGNPLSFFRYHESEKRFSQVDEIPQRDLDLVLRALHSNTSIKKFTLKDEKELDEKNIQCLYDLTKIRPSLTCDFAVSTMQQLKILQRLDYTSQQLQSYQSQSQSLTTNLGLKSKEIESLKAKHDEELKAREKAFLEKDKEKNEEIHKLKKNERYLKNELNRSTEFSNQLLEEKQEYVLKIKELEQTIEENAREIKQRDKLLENAKNHSIDSLEEELKKVKVLDQNKLRLLVDNRCSIEYWNLIPFRDDKLLQKPILEKLIAKKAITDIKSLFTVMNSLDENSSMKKIKKLLSILDELTCHYTNLPLSIKNEMKNLIQSNSQILLSIGAAKEQYNAYVLSWKQKMYAGDDETDLDSVPVSKKIKEEAISQILCSPLNKNVENAIEEAGKKILNEFANKLKLKLSNKPGFFSSTQSGIINNEEKTRENQLI